MIKLPVYNQTDPRWRNLPLGTTGNTIGSHGCTITCLSMALENWAIRRTPDQVVEDLKAQGGFMPSGDLLWLSVPKAYPSVHFHYRWYTTLEEPMYSFRINPEAALIKIKRLIALGQPVLLNVDALYADKRPDHWVVAHDFVGEPIITDPAYGETSVFSKRYGSPMTGIYGFTTLVGPPMAFPDWSTDQKDGHAAWKAAQIARGRDVQTYAKEILDTLI